MTDPEKMTKKERMSLNVAQKSYLAQDKILDIFNFIFYLLIIDCVLIVTNYAVINYLFNKNDFLEYQKLSETLLSIAVFAFLPTLLFFYLTKSLFKRGKKKRERVYSRIGLLLASIFSFPVLLFSAGGALYGLFSEGSGLTLNKEAPFGQIDGLVSIPYFLVDSLNLVFNVESLNTNHKFYIILLFITILLALSAIFTVYLFIIFMSWSLIPRAYHQTFKLAPASLLIDDELKITNAIDQDFNKIQEIYTSSTSIFDPRINMRMLQSFEVRVLLKVGEIVGFYFYPSDDRYKSLSQIFTTSPEYLHYLEKDRMVLNV